MEKTLLERYEELCADIRQQCMAEMFAKLSGMNETAPVARATAAPRQTDMETAMRTIVSYVKKHPKSTLIQIKEGTGLEVKRPMAKLKASAALRQVGEGRGTRYSVR